MVFVITLLGTFLTISLAASDSLLTLSRSNSCLKDLVAEFVRADDCAELNDKAKNKVSYAWFSLQWGWQSASCFLWTSLFLPNAKTITAIWKETHGALLLLSSRMSITYAISIGKPCTTNELSPSSANWASLPPKLSKLSDKMPRKPTRFSPCNKRCTIIWTNP